MKLYELSEEYEKALTGIVDADTGEIDEDAVKALSEINDSINEKGISVAMFIQNRNAEVDALKAEEKRLAERRKALERRNDWLKTYLLENMQRCGIKEISSPLFSIKLKKCPPSVDIHDENLIPNKYIKVVESVTVDRKMISMDIRGGEDVPGASLKQRETVVIK